MPRLGRHEERNDGLGPDIRLRKIDEACAAHLVLDHALGDNLDQRRLAQPAHHPELARRHVMRWLGGKAEFLKA